MSKPLEIIEEALRANRITPQRAEFLIYQLEFFERCKYVLDWGKYYFPHKFTLEFCYELHNYMVEIMHERFTSTLAPRGSAKTTIKCFLIPIYLACNFPNLYHHFLNIQNTATKAIDENKSIMLEIETNDKLIKDYGDLTAQEKWTESKFVLKNGVIFSALGAGQSMRGMNYRNKRPDYILIDDLYEDKDRNNPARIKKKDDWFWGSVFKCVPKHKNFCIHIQGTAIHGTDLMHKTAKKKRWKHRKFQAITNWDKKLVLWPEAETFESLLEDKEDMGTIIFEREMQNNPREDASSIIKQSWIQLYDGNLPMSDDEGKETISNIDGNCDPSVGRKATSDYTAMVAIYISNYGNYYIHDVINEHLTFANRKITAINFHARHGFRIFRVEAISAFQDFSEDLKKTTSVPVKTITCVNDKISRLEAVSAKFESKKVFINSKIEPKLLEEIIYQLINNEPEHDDIRDAIVLGLEEKKKKGLMMGFIG